MAKKPHKDSENMGNSMKRSGGGPWQGLVQLLSAVTLLRKAKAIICDPTHTHTITLTLRTESNHVTGSEQEAVIHPTLVV